MRILYLLNSGQIGGMEKHVVDLTLGMSNLGHEVFVWCPEGPLQLKLDMAGGFVYTEPINHDIDIKFISKLVQFLRLKKIDVIHTHELKSGVNGLIAAGIVGTEVRVSHTHTPISEWKIGPVKKMVDIILSTFFITLVDSMEIALTKTREEVKRKEGIRDENLMVIPNAIDIDSMKISTTQKEDFNREIRGRYKIPMDAYIIGNISRMTKEKGHDILVASFKKIYEDNQNVYLLLGGGGALQNEIETQIDNLGLSDRCVVTGVFPDEDLPKLYASFDSFVFPTLAEGFGYVLIEAMYSGVPIVCSDLPVLQEVGGNTVTYFKTGSVVSLTNKLEKLLTDESEFTELVAAAKERVVSEYSMTKFIQNYNKLYEMLYQRYQALHKKKK